jgi:DNA topoisomerase-1
MKKWTTLRHNGVAFPPEYVPQGLALGIHGERVLLPPLAEEMAIAWARKKGTPYVADSVFIQNFLGDFRPQLPPRWAHMTLADLDFTFVDQWVEAEKLRKADPTRKKQLAAERKLRREELRAHYGMAEVDGEPTPIANWLVEPPGLFMGRGAHPLRGHWKPRITPNEVTLNLGEEAPVPAGQWGAIVHDHNSMWMARWIDKLTRKEKYVWLADTADLRQERDRAKYDKAFRLRLRLPHVRAFIQRQLRADQPRDRALATACYLIDVLALRIGDEKDPDEADTVGATTLRVEHLRFAPDAIEFDFYGKDFVRWNKSVAVHELDRAFVQNLRQLCANKPPTALVFSDVNSGTVNRFLDRAMDGLTAKVFRTHHATEVVERYLREHDRFPADASAHVKLYHARLANLDAALRCNHVRTPPRTWEQSFQRKLERLQKLRQEKPKTPKATERQRERITKLELEVELVQRTKIYNLNTSLRNYIDPRVYKAWGQAVDFDWHQLYTTSLQRKFAWANLGRTRWPFLPVASPERALQRSRSAPSPASELSHSAGGPAV